MEPPIVPGPTGGEALRWWARMARDPLATYVGLQRTYGDAVRIPFRRHRPLLLLSRPEHAEHVLVVRQHNYVKAVTYRPLRAFLGSGLLTSEGEVWERHRRIVGPVFARRHLTGFAPEIVAAAERRTATWHKDGDIVEVGGQMRALTLDVVGRALFGASLGGSAQRIGDALGAVQRVAIIGELLVSVAPERAGWTWLRRLPGVAGPADTLDAIVAEIVAKRRAEPSPPADRDLLDLLLAARDQDGSRLDGGEIRDEVLTLMLAGHETTSNALTWTLALLSRFPAARRRLEAEVDDVLANRAASADDVDRLSFTEAVINEAMRLYPPAWTHRTRRGRRRRDRRNTRRGGNDRRSGPLPPAPAPRVLARPRRLRPGPLPDRRRSVPLRFPALRWRTTYLRGRRLCHVRSQALAGQHRPDVPPRSRIRRHALRSSGGHPAAPRPGAYAAGAAVR